MAAKCGDVSMESTAFRLLMLRSNEDETARLNVPPLETNPTGPLAAAAAAAIKTACC